MLSQAHVINLLHSCIVFIGLLLSGCSEQAPTMTIDWSWQTFPSRNLNDSLDRPHIYRAKVPLNWIRKDPIAKQSIVDTTLANCEFIVPEYQTVRLTFHTFPYFNQEPRIGSDFQLGRWKRQFDVLDSHLIETRTQKRHGYSGLFINAIGIKDEKPYQILGWSMQLTQPYEQKLKFSPLYEDQIKRADYTLKVTGNPEEIAALYDSLILFSNSFELIHELPCP